jgi:SAM-dependent methyltransferase
MKVLDDIHGRFTYRRRVHKLCDHLVEMLPPQASVLDVGCGDGELAHLIMEQQPNIQIKGVDVLVREQTQIPVAPFDGQRIPYPDASFDVVMFSDVLHHTDDPLILLREAMRVARSSVVLKDHTCDGPFADLTLRFMDYVGNARHGVALPFNYWPKEKWLSAFDSLGVVIGAWKKDLRLYPRWADPVFGRSLHFVARLDRGQNHLRERVA